MYNSATYTRANVEKTAHSQVRLDARSDYRLEYMPNTVSSLILWETEMCEICQPGAL